MHHYCPKWAEEMIENTSLGLVACLLFVVVNRTFGPFSPAIDDTATHFHVHLHMTCLLVACTRKYPGSNNCTTLNKPWPGKILTCQLTFAATILIISPCVLCLSLYHSDEKRRERYDCFQAPEQVERLGVGEVQRQADLQRRKTWIHHCISESFSVSVSLSVALLLAEIR